MLSFRFGIVLTKTCVTGTSAVPSSFDSVHAVNEDPWEIPVTRYPGSPVTVCSHIGLKQRIFLRRIGIEL